MTPFLQFRLWVRRAPGMERASVAVAGVVMLALVGWALVPSGGLAGTSTSVVAGSRSAAGGGASTPFGATDAGGAALDGSPAAGAGGAGGASRSVGGAGASSTAGSPNGAAGPTAAGGECSDLRVTDQGMTTKDVTIGIVLVAIAGQVGNSLVGVPSPDDQKKDFDAVIAGVNKAGGVRCRTLVPKYYEANPLDSSQQHATCLQLVQDKVFAVLEVAAMDYPATNRDCVPQNKLPMIDVVPIADSEAAAFSPYLFSYTGSWGTIIKNQIQAISRMRWFDGAKNIGVLKDSCIPEVSQQLLDELGRVGIARNRIVTYDYGCPTGVVPPTQIQQAVLKFKTSDVSHVIDAGTATLDDFSKQAQQQQYKPRYSLPDGGFVAVSGTANSAPDPQNFDGAIAITPYAYGAENSGIPFGPETDRCNAMLAAGGMPPAQKQSVAFGGSACGLVRMLQVAMEHAPTLTRANLAAGLAAAGRVEFAFPIGPADFGAGRHTTGGQFWRPVTYNGACACWKVMDATWQPRFA